jgi:intraflagellar transport protein 81
MTLADISTTVEHINKSINDRKAKLAPDIKKLRQMRQDFAVSISV